MARLSIPLVVALCLAGAVHAATTPGAMTNTTNVTMSGGGIATPGVLSPSNQTSSSPSASQTTSGTARTNGTRTDTAGTVSGATGGADFVIGANGERIPVETSGTQPAPAATPATPELDAATRTAAARERAKVARKQQLMHSITPRTNNDRSDQMPDDPVSPALTPPAQAPRAR